MPITQLHLDATTTATKAWAELTRVFRSAALESPVIDSRLLICHVLGLDRLGLLREPHRPLADHAGPLIAAARRRLACEPVSRIVGERYFWGRPFKITPATLVALAMAMVNSSPEKCGASTTSTPTKPIVTADQR